MAARRRSRSVTVALVGVAACLMVAATLAAARGAMDLSTRPAAAAAPSTAVGSTCPRPIRVVSSAAFAPVLTTLAPRFAAAGGCPGVVVVPADGEAAVEIVRADPVDAWIPDDPAWAATMADGVLAGAGISGSGRTLAISPVYPTQFGGARNASTTWSAIERSVRGGRQRLVLTAPGDSGAGLIGLAALQAAARERSGRQAATSMLLAISGSARVPRADQPAWPMASDEVALVPEYALSTGVGRPEGVGVVGTTDGLPTLRFIWYPSAKAAADPQRSAVLKRLLTLLRGPDGTQALATAGLRRPGGGPPEAARAVVPRESATGPLMEPVAAAEAAQVLTTWYPHRRRAGMLIAIDTSGSMARQLRGGEAVLDAAREGAAAVAEALPDEAEVGLWEFATNLSAIGDAREVVPRAALTPEHRGALGAGLDGLALRPVGTGLYDTILTAYEAAAAAGRDDLPGHVVVISDGRNEADPGSINAAQLSARLEELTADRASGGPPHLTVLMFGRGPAVAALRGAVAPAEGRVVTVGRAEDVRAAVIRMLGEVATPAT